MSLEASLSSMTLTVGDREIPTKLFRWKIKETEEVIPKSSVRLLACGIQEEADPLDLLSSDHPVFLTTVAMELKSSKSFHSGDLMLPGVDMKKAKKKSPEETIVGAATEGLEEELFVFGATGSKLQVLTTRQYEYLHPGNNGHVPAHASYRNVSEVILRADIPPLLHSGQLESYFPRRKVGGIQLFSPDQFDTVLSEEKWIDADGTVHHLVDSLSTLPEAEGRRERYEVCTDGREDIVKQTLVSTAYEQEVAIRMELLSQLINISSLDDFDMYERELEVFKNSKEPWNAEQFQYFDTQYRTILRELKEKMYWIGIPKSDFRSKMQEAWWRVRLEKSLPAIGESGPQQPYLLGQMMLQGESLKTYDYDQISASPELKGLYDVMLATFDIDPKREWQWFQRLQEELKTFSELKRNIILRRTAYPRAEEEYQEFRKRLHDAFFYQFGIGGELLTQRFDDVVKLDEYIGSAIAHVADPLLRGELLANGVEQGNLSLEDLFFTMAGVSDQGDAYMTRWRAMRTLLDVVLLDRVNEIRQMNYFRPVGLDPIDVLFHTYMAKVGKKDVGGESLDVYESKPLGFWDILPVGKENTQFFRLTDFPVRMTVRHRPIKELASIFRKIMERGVIDPGLYERHQLGASEEDMRIDDFFGKQLIIDNDAFWEKFITVYPGHESEKEEILDAWARYSVQWFLGEFSEAIHSGYDVDFVKRRSTGAFASIGNGREQHSGSAVSDAQWAWFKYVLRLKRDGFLWSEEHQIFQDEQGLSDKEKNQRQVFGLRRAVKTHASGRFPHILVRYGVKNPACLAIMEQYKEYEAGNGNTQ